MIAYTGKILHLLGPIIFIGLFIEIYSFFAQFRLISGLVQALSFFPSNINFVTGTNVFFNLSTIYGELDLPQTYVHNDCTFEIQASVLGDWCP